MRCIVGRILSVALAFGVPFSVQAQAARTLRADETQRPRLIILADMGNEPDEEQQMTHMLVNCNEFELEGLLAVTGKFLNETAKTSFKQVVHPELFHKLIDGYAQVEANLRLHADNWPSADFLHSIVHAGQQRYGLADVGEGKSTDGSRLILCAIDGDHSDRILIRRVCGRTDVTLDASASSDPDGDALSYSWYFYPEAGRYRNDLPPIEGQHTSCCSFHLPDDSGGKQPYLVLELHDHNDIVSLTDYRRVIFEVQPWIAPSSLIPQSRRHSHKTVRAPRNPDVPNA